MSGMFGGGSTNPYDDIVAKTTDENLTTENWELILNLCDKVADEGPEGARNVIAAILKRLSHRNPNVQLYALSLVEALSKNCDVEVHKEIASRAFTQGLEKLVTDRNTHEKVRRKTLELIAMWTNEFEHDPQLGVMEDCYNNLKSKNYKFEPPTEPPPPAVDDEIRRKEEEELQRVLEMSITDKGGRDAYTSQWDSYGASGSGSGGSGSGVGSTSNLASASGSGVTGGSSTTPATGFSTYGGGSGPGYVPAPERQSSLPPSAAAVHTSTSAPSSSHGHGNGAAGTATTTGSAGPQSPIMPPSLDNPIVTRVRALHTFEPSEAGELGFQKGDIIKVVDRGYKDWWRGQLKGRTGIFPVNYVEPLPEPTANELAREAEQEAAVFAQAVNVEKLLNMLRALDPQKDNLADNEEIQELYRSSMALRPKIVKLIDKYSQKRADLVSMNETFIRARTIFDQMMEESLARHTGVYESGYRPPGAPAYGTDPRDYGTSPAPGPGGYAPAGAWGAPPSAGPGPQGYGPPQFPQAQPVAVGAPTPGAYPGPQQPGHYGGQPQPQPQPGAQYGPQPQPQPYGVGVQQAGPGQPDPQQHVQPQAQAQQPQPIQQQQAQIQPQQQVQPQQQQIQPQQQQQQAADPNAGPPYVYDPNGTYSDPNVQAWAQYYAQGGKDPTGSVYFLSVPGVKEGPGLQQAQQQPQTQQIGIGGAGADQGQGVGQQQQHQGQQQQQQPHQVYQPQQQPQQQPLGTSPTSSTFNPNSYPQQQPQASASAESLPNLPYPGGPGGASLGRSDSVNLPYPGSASASVRSDSLPYPGPASDRSDSLPYPGPASPPHNGSTSSLGTYGTPAYGASPYGPTGQQQSSQSVHTAHQQPIDPRSSTGSLMNVGGAGAPGLAFDPTPAAVPHTQGQQPLPASPISASGHHSPAAAHSSTPSWVLPKVETSSRFGAGGLPSQMSGLNLGGHGGSSHGHGQTSPGLA